MTSAQIFEIWKVANAYLNIDGMIKRILFCCALFTIRLYVFKQAAASFSFFFEILSLAPQAGIYSFCSRGGPEDDTSATIS